MDLMDLTAGRAEVVTQGEWTEDDVVVTADGSFSPKVTDQMKTAALARFLTRRETNADLFDGPARNLYRVAKGARLELFIGPTTYALYDVCRGEFAKAFGWNTDDLPLGIGMSAVVITADSKIVMQHRGAKVDFPGITALVGGILDEDNPFDHVRKELWEELGIRHSEVNTLLLLGISHRVEQRINNELDFFAHVSLTSHELTLRQEGVVYKEGELRFLDCDPRAVREFVMKKHCEMLPGQIFCLVQAGRHLWGPEWSKLSIEEVSRMTGKEEQLPVPMSVINLCVDATCQHNDGSLMQAARDQLRDIQNYIQAVLSLGTTTGIVSYRVPADVKQLSYDAVFLRPLTNLKRDYAVRQLKLALEAIDKVIGGC